MSLRGAACASAAAALLLALASPPGAAADAARCTNPAFAPTLSGGQATCDTAPAAPPPRSVYAPGGGGALTLSWVDVAPSTPPGALRGATITYRHGYACAPPGTPVPVTGARLNSVPLANVSYTPPLHCSLCDDPPASPSGGVVVLALPLGAYVTGGANTLTLLFDAEGGSDGTDGSDDGLVGLFADESGQVAVVDVARETTSADAGDCPTPTASLSASASPRPASASRSPATAAATPLPSGCRAARSYTESQPAAPFGMPSTCAAAGGGGAYGGVYLDAPSSPPPAGDDGKLGFTWDDATPAGVWVESASLRYAHSLGGCDGMNYTVVFNGVRLGVYTPSGACDACAPPGASPPPVRTWSLPASVYNAGGVNRVALLPPIPAAARLGVRPLPGTADTLAAVTVTRAKYRVGGCGGTPLRSQTRSRSQSSTRSGTASRRPTPTRTPVPRGCVKSSAVALSGVALDGLDGVCARVVANTEGQEVLFTWDDATPAGAWVAAASLRFAHALACVPAPIRYLLNGVPAGTYTPPPSCAVCDSPVPASPPPSAFTTLVLPAESYNAGGVNVVTLDTGGGAASGGGQVGFRDTGLVAPRWATLNVTRVVYDAARCGGAPIRSQTASRSITPTPTPTVVPSGCPVRRTSGSMEPVLTGVYAMCANGVERYGVGKVGLVWTDANPPGGWLARGTVRFAPAMMCGAGARGVFLNAVRLGSVSPPSVCACAPSAPAATAAAAVVTFTLPPDAFVQGGRNELWVEGLATGGGGGGGGLQGFAHSPTLLGGAYAEVNVTWARYDAGACMPFTTPTPSRTPAPSPTCGGVAGNVTRLFGVAGQAPAVATRDGTLGLHATGACTRGFTKFFAGRRVVYQLDLGAGTPLGGALRVSTCGLTRGNTVLYVGTGCPTSAAAFGCLAGNNNGGQDGGGEECYTNPAASTLDLDGVPARFLYIQMGGNNAASLTSGLRWRYDPPARATATPSSKHKRAAV